MVNHGVSQQPNPQSLPTLADVEAAATAIAGIVTRTPLIRLPVDLPGGHPVYAKAESLQRTGSFKIRGALNKLASMTPEERGRGVVAHSSGNHAQGVAAAAKHFGVNATIVIPRGASELKVRRTEELGATVVRCDDTQAAREGEAARIVEETGATLVHPYNDPLILAGQGTAGLEIAADLPDVANVLVPIGGGGLSSGVALALAAKAPGARVFGVEPELGADARESLLAGEIRAWPATSTTKTMADGVRTQSIGAINFALLSKLLAGVVTVDEASIAAATRWYHQEAHLVVEPTGAITLAALLRLAREGSVDGLELQDGPSVVLVSGGNVDASRLAGILAG